MLKALLYLLAACTVASKERVNKIKTISNKPYDDAFKSALFHCRQVVVPLVNEVFKTNYRLDDTIKFRNTELYNLKGDTERDVDTTFSVGDSKILYHFECESSSEDIIVRMFEYDAMISLQEPEVGNGKMRVRFPRSAVLYLRSTSTTSDKYEITIEAGDREFSYFIPTLKVGDYSLDDIFAKKLYFLLPFHFFVYEKDFEYYNNGSKDIKLLLAEFDYWLERLEQVDDKVLTADVKASLQEYTYNVAVALTHKYDVLGQEVRQYMGGIVTQYSPVEARIIRAVDEAVGKAVDKVTKEKDAEFAKQKAEFAKQKAQDQATIENLRAEIERLKAERSA